MSLQNLTEDFLYDLLPSAIIDLDEQGLIQAVVGGYQDRIDDVRSYASKFELLVTGSGVPETDNSGNAVNNVVLCLVQSPQGKVYNRSLDFKDGTPPNGTPALVTWAAAQLNLDEDHVLISAAYGVDMLRLVDANILAYLASTIGAVLYQTAAMDPNNAQSDARRLIQTWFPRLQFKGTSQSFETLGRLLGFDDVRMMPLYGRLSPRITNDIGDPANNQDFSITPEYFPKQARDNFYDPLVLNDGPFFTWTGTATALFGTNDTNFYTQVTNGFNPFVTVSQIGIAPQDPDPAGSPYYLVGGGPESFASVSPPGSGLLFKAISAGSSFNGLGINVLAIQNGTYRVLSITDRLSAVKYRTSYYDLALTVDFDHALNQFGTNVASTNKDLATNPAFANFGSVALSPFRPWMGGSVQVQVNTLDWLIETIQNGNLAVIRPRSQSDLTSREYDLQAVSAAGAQVVQAMEEVRPATRTARQVSTGFLIRDQIGFAPYGSSKSLFTSSGSIQKTYWGTLNGFPMPPYNVGFSAFTGSSGTVAFVGETDLVNSGFVRFLLPDLTISGTYDYSNSTWLFTFAGSVATGTTLISSYVPTSTEVIRTNPGTNYPTVAYQARPEDQFDAANAMDAADEYPWRRNITDGGELIDFDSYAPAVSDIATVPLGDTVAVSSQTGAQYDVQVIVPGPSPPRFITAARDLDRYVPGQQAIAFTGTFLDLAGSRPGSGTLLGGLDSVMQAGWQIYHFGLVQGVLVADPVKFFGLHHRRGLALWLPFNEQPLDALHVSDHSPFEGDPFVNGLASGDRLFDPARGNYLRAQPGLALTSTIARGFSQPFAGGFWLRAMNSYANEQTILLSGPLKITLSGAVNTPQANFYLRASSGSYNLQASQAFNQNWVYLSWSFNGNQTLTLDFFNSAGALTEQIITVPFLPDFATACSFSLLCQNSSFDIQDLRLWNVPKSSTELGTARYHSPNPTAALYRPAWLQSVNTYDEFAVRVLPSGYVVPEQLPTSIINNKLAWIQRYDYFGRYRAQSRYDEVGIGSGNTLPQIQRLGVQWDTLTLDGTVAISTWKGNFVGDNAPFRTETTAGTYLSLPEAALTASGITALRLYSGTSVPWPNPLQATNPCRDRVWLKGDDGYVWEVTLQTTNGSTQFSTQKLFSLTGSYQPTGAQVTVATATGTSGQYYTYSTSPGNVLQVNVFNNSLQPIYGSNFAFFNGATTTGQHVANPGDQNQNVVSAAPGSGNPWSFLYFGSVFYSEPGVSHSVQLNYFFSDPIPNGQVAVNTSGVVYQGTYTGTTITDPLYLYSTRETRVALSGTNTVAAWVQPNSFGLGQTPPVPALSQDGQLAFQINNTLPSGFYRITIKSGNIGKVDGNFAGFYVIMTVGDFVLPVRLCTGRSGANFSAVDSFDFFLPHALPGSPSSWLLTFDWSNSLKDIQKGTTRQLFIGEITITQTHSSLYQITTGTNVTITPMITAGSTFPVTPGGWLGMVSSWGTVSNYTHESSVYSSNDTLTDPEPMANKLAATTMYRREDLIMNGSFCLPDTTTPLLPVYGSLIVT